MKKSVLYGILAVAGLGLASAAQAYEIRTQWVSRIGAGVPVTVVPGNTFDATALAAGTVVRFRLQFGVFDDGAGPAPAGGYLGWNVGTLTATGGSPNTRTPGRLTPFNFAPAPPGNGMPAADPWMALTGVDNTLGTQPLPWNSQQGNPDVPPPPPAVVRGLNSFISTFEISTTIGGGANYTIIAGGNALGCLMWNIVQQTPPAPGEDEILGTPDDVAGSILYAPLADAARSFSNTLSILVPAPGALALLGLGGLVATRRRRA